MRYQVSSSVLLQNVVVRVSLDGFSPPFKIRAQTWATMLVFRLTKFKSSIFEFVAPPISGEHLSLSMQGKNLRLCTSKTWVVPGKSGTAPFFSAVLRANR